MTLLLRVLCPLITLLMLSGEARAQGAVEDFGELDRWVEEQAARHAVPGLSYAVIRGGRRVHSHSLGDDGRGGAFTGDTPVVIGSLSKSFTAVVVMRLHEAGRLDIDDPLGAHLPGLVASIPGAEAVTLRHLLVQSSGVPTRTPLPPPGAEALSDYVEALEGIALEIPPGERHLYSSANSQVLGLVAERAAGRPFAELVEEVIFAPLEMTRSFTGSAPAREAGLARGHRYWFGWPLPSSLPYEPGRLPSATLISSAHDLARYLGAHLEGQLASPEGMATLHAPAAPAGSFDYAMGWRVGPTAGEPSLWHGGAMPDYRTALVMLPERGEGVVVVSNGATLLVDHTRSIAEGIVAGLVAEAPPEPERTVRGLYRVIALVAAGLLLWNLRGLWMLRRFDPTERLRERGVARAALPVLLWELALPAAVLVMLPSWMGLPWRRMAASLPDVTAATVVLLGLTMLGGLVKGRALWRAWRETAAEGERL